MKKLFILLIPLISFAACKKVINNAAENAIVRAMTDGQWVITSFKDNGTDITSDFSSYKFQYYANRKVDAIKNGSVERTGNWEGYASTLSIWATFPGAIYPLNLIDGTWQITRNSWTFVEAKKTVGADVKTLRLDKL